MRSASSEEPSKSRPPTITCIPAARNADTVRPGDVFALNAPYDGGTHLPDITVVTPLHDETGALYGFVASRGHHADIGGITPGSMPAFSSRLSDEGVIFRSMKLVHEGVFQESALRTHLASGPYPARRPEQNVADLQAQIAANHHGAERMEQTVRKYGLPCVQAYMKHIQEHARERVEQAISSIDDGLRSWARNVAWSRNAAT